MATVTLDTIIAAETPEGITLELRPAGLPVRLLAFLVDSAIRVGLLIGLAQALQFFSDLGFGLFLVSWFLLEWLYPVAFELLPRGATPGKRIFGLKVIMESGLPVTPAASLTRNLLRTADFLPGFYGFGMVCMLLRADFKRLGDLAAGTLVVYEPTRSQLVALATVAPPALPVAPRRPLTLRDQAAIVDLAARAPRLTPQRVEELAGLAASITRDPKQSPTEITREVLAVAHWLLGRRPEPRRDR